MLYVSGAPCCAAVVNIRRVLFLSVVLLAADISCVICRTTPLQQCRGTDRSSRFQDPGSGGLRPAACAVIGRSAVDTWWRVSHWTGGLYSEAGSTAEVRQKPDTRVVGEVWPASKPGRMNSIGV